MGLIGQITFINQNVQVPSTVAADAVARTIGSEEVKKIIEKEKEVKVTKVKPVEEIEKILSDNDSKEDVEREIKHLDIYI